MSYTNITEQALIFLFPHLILTQRFTSFELKHIRHKTQCQGFIYTGDISHTCYFFHILSQTMPWKTYFTCLSPYVLCLYNWLHTLSYNPPINRLLVKKCSLLIFRFLNNDQICSSTLLQKVLTSNE